jgi:hypothetical protein
MSASLRNKPAHALDREGLPDRIIGGQAVLLYGEPRLTRDVDLTVAATPEEFDRVWRVVQEAQLQPLIEDPRSFVRQTWVLPTLDAESGLRVDFIFSWTPYEREAIARARVVPVLGYPVRFAAPEDAIVHKALAGRPRDWEDVGSILRKQSVDPEEIRRWLRAFSESLGRDLLSPFETIWAEETGRRAADR